VLLRAQAISALTKSLSSAGRAVPDPIAKDLLRYLKNGLSDNALAVQRTCAEALAALQECTSVITTLSDIENIITLVVKALDKTDHPTKRSMSKLVAHLLAFTQDASSVVAPPPDKNDRHFGCSRSHHIPAHPASHAQNPFGAFQPITSPGKENEERHL
jgi:hypothetical protein